RSTSRHAPTANPDNGARRRRRAPVIFPTSGPMIEFYPQIKHAHIGLALLSGALFALRGALLLGGLRWPNAAPVRYASYAIDTALLTAALMLLTILPGALYANGWLAVKLVLVVAYVVLGVFALRRGRTRGMRAAC